MEQYVLWVALDLCAALGLQATEPAGDNSRSGMGVKRWVLGV